MNTPPAAPAQTGWTLIFLAWLVATVATLSALFLGEVMGYTPCVLCWYQRICMFPLAVVLPFGMFPPTRRVIGAGIALAVPGLALALFHQLLVAGVIPERIQPCSQGVPCSQTVATWFGFLTLPLLSIAAFAAILALLLAAFRRSPP